jgi:hypothetical protein
VSHLEIEKDWRPVDVWMDLLEAFDSDDVQRALEARDEFAEKYLVRGQLLVTTAQFAELDKIRQAQEAESLHDQRSWLEAVGAPSLRAPRITDIPVRLVTEVPIDLGGGLKAIHAHGRIYVFREVDYMAQLPIMKMEPNPIFAEHTTWGGEPAPATEKERLMGDDPNHQSNGSTGDSHDG